MKYLTKKMRNLFLKIINKCLAIYVSYSLGKVQGKQISILCNNCIAGIIYNDLNRQFLSPTINVFFYGEDYLDFLENLNYYLNQQMSFSNQSKHFPEQSPYPIGKIKNIEIHFLHYSSNSEALAKWNERKLRLNFDDMVIIGSDRDTQNRDDVIERFSKLHFKKKVFFTSNKTDNPGFVYFPRYRDSSSIGDLISDNKAWYFHFKVHKFFNHGIVETNISMRNLFLLMSYLKSKIS